MDPETARLLASTGVEVLSGLFVGLASNAIHEIVVELKKGSDKRELDKIEEIRRSFEDAKSLEELFDAKIIKAAKGLKGDCTAVTHLRDRLACDPILTSRFRVWSVTFALDEAKANAARREVLDIVKASAEKEHIPWDMLEPVLKGLFRKILLLVRGKYGPYLEGFEHREILRILRILLERSEKPAAPTYSLLHQIPAAPRDFTGREAELARLRDEITKGNVAISGLKGMGGVGKTALALRLAEELRPSFPDAQIYLDLKGTAAKAEDRVSSTKAMEHVIRSFYPKAELPEDEAQIDAIYRSTLSGKQVLLLMDNAMDAQQVAPLAPPEGNLLLVTSRSNFSLSGWVSINVDVLPIEDSKDLLLKICPRIGDGAEELAELCGRLPLALCLAGGALAARKDIDVDSYIKDLTNARSRIDKLDEFKKCTDAEKTVEAAFSESYRLLTEEEQRLWRCLGVFPASFMSVSAAAVCGMEPDAEAKMLGDLLFFNLVEWTEENRRYRLHDLARDFAAARMREAGEEYTTGKRHAEYHLEVLSWAEREYLKGGYNVLVGLAIFDGERVNIEAGFKWAAGNITSDDDALRMTSRYPNVGVHCLNLRQHPRKERMPWLETGLAAARKLKDRRAEGAHLGHLGIVYHALGDAPRAIEYFKQALAIAKKLGDKADEGAAYGNLGMAYAALGETEKAIKCYEKHRKIASSVGDRRGEANALGNLSVAYLSLGNTQKAMEYCEESLAIAREIGDRQGEATSYSELGLVYSALRDVRKAIEYYEKAFVIAREIGDRMGQGHALWRKALALYSLGRRREAILLGEEALKAHEDFETPHVSMLRATLEKWKAGR